MATYSKRQATTAWLIKPELIRPDKLHQQFSNTALDTIMNTRIKIRFYLTAILAGGLLCSQMAFASDIAKGKKLYDQKCQGCHDNKIHTRPNRIIHTYEDLVGRVKFCDNAAKANFSEAEITDVIDYLNDAFYKFVK